VQHDPMGPDFDSEALDPDGWMWARGVDYVAGWRSAKDAAAELAAAMAEAGIDTSGMTSRADTAADGSGILRLSLPADAARALAEVARAEALRWREAG
jgi:hypothetical protein